MLQKFFTFIKHKICKWRKFYYVVRKFLIVYNFDREFSDCGAIYNSPPETGPRIKGIL